MKSRRIGRVCFGGIVTAVLAYVWVFTSQILANSTFLIILAVLLGISSVAAASIISAAWLVNKWKRQIWGIFYILMGVVSPLILLALLIIYLATLIGLLLGAAGCLAKKFFFTKV